MDARMLDSFRGGNEIIPAALFPIPPKLNPPPVEQNDPSVSFDQGRAIENGAKCPKNGQVESRDLFYHLQATPPFTPRKLLRPRRATAGFLSAPQAL